MTTIKAKDANGQWVRIAGGSFFWRGTKAAYDAIPTKDPAVLYVIEDESTSAWLTDGAADARYVNVAGDTMTGNLTVQKVSPAITVDATSGQAAVIIKSANSSAYYYADSAAGQYAGLVLRDAATNKNRWLLAKTNTAEPGSNAGSDLVLLRYGDDGVYIGSAASINRATGKVTLVGSVEAGEIVQAGDSGGKVALESSGGRRMVTGRLANGTMRWALRLGDVTSSPETGNNAGSDFFLQAYNDAGTILHTPIRIYRSTGLMVLAGDPTAALGAATKQYVDNKGVWQAYTPTLTGITLGTGGSVAGRYTRIGNTIHYEARFSFGTGGSVNEAGGKSVSLPVAIRSGSKGLHNAHVGNSAAYFMLNAFIVGGTTAISLNGISADGSASNITNTHPVAIPGSSTTFYVTGTYEAA